MPAVKLDTGFNIEVDFVITPFHRRLLAWAIDLLIMFAYSWLAGKVLSLFQTRSWSIPFWLVLVARLPILFYHLGFEILMDGQSPGKLVMGMKVLTIDGGQPSISQYLIRWLFRSIDFPVFIMAAMIQGMLPAWCFIFLFVGIACVFLTAHSQRTGDLVAGTIVVNTKNNVSWEDTVFTELESNYQPMYSQVMQLSDNDINTIKSIIEAVKKKRDDGYAIRVGDRIRSKLHISSDQEPLEFLETLLKDYNYYSTV